YYLMKKRNIGFILFGVAGANLITLAISIIIFPVLYERLGMPITAARIGISTIFITSLVTISILVVVGIIVLIKFWNR
ncbi:MAG: hypothetical protein ACFE9C_16040, partial [Candidatus Hodarchaeota archaeon]